MGWQDSQVTIVKNGRDYTITMAQAVNHDSGELEWRAVNRNYPSMEEAQKESRKILEELYRKVNK